MTENLSNLLIRSVDSGGSAVVGRWYYYACFFGEEAVVFLGKDEVVVMFISCNNAPRKALYIYSRNDEFRTYFMHSECRLNHNILPVGLIFGNTLGSLLGTLID